MGGPLYAKLVYIVDIYVHFAPQGVHLEYINAPIKDRGYILNG